MIKSNSYFYTINFPKYEEDLGKTELRYLFKQDIKYKYLFSDFYIPISRSAFLKECVSIIYTADTLEEIVERITLDNASYDNFKVRYIKHEGDALSHEERLKANYAVGYAINGEADVHNPRIILGISKVGNQWIFGVHEKNNLEWQGREQKPYSYSNALGVRTARALVNIAAAGNEDCTIVDPCCGIGTVVIEALSLGMNIEGYEINPLIGENAKKNLKYFGYEDVITIGDMHEIKKHYNIAIVDLPYGLFNPTTLKEQTDIMKTARRIADRAIIVTMKDMDEYIIKAGFTIVDKTSVSKGNFKRYIAICR
ncbi:TRM11 family SAM-dependent methyltransferase [Clostridium thermarum]|uniref:TRM11 family SAM-dependent methyltransferase n=1 Tax=Clostridium thermarum TaxID=1716543 RepID=UPI00112156EA|nr:RsmD family RNA methyltransferase [Clostridium thermarum]